VSESAGPEVFSHLASIKAIVADMESLKEHVRRISNLLEVIVGLVCLDREPLFFACDRRAHVEGACGSTSTLNHVGRPQPSTLNSK
jgi:hypothetical protein